MVVAGVTGPKQDLRLDPARTHWLGSLQTEAYQRVLACSDVHLLSHGSLCAQLEFA